MIANVICDYYVKININTNMGLGDTCSINEVDGRRSECTRIKFNLIILI